MNNAENATMNFLASVSVFAPDFAGRGSIGPVPDNAACSSRVMRKTLP